MIKAIILLLIFILCRCVNVVSVKRAQTGSGGLYRRMTFTCLMTLLQGILLFVLPPYTTLSFTAERLLYPGLYAVFYIIYMVLNVGALRIGPTSLTQVILSFNSLFPVLLGVLLWGDRMVLPQWLGLLLFAASLFLFNTGDYRESAVKKPITGKWVVTTLLSLLFSGSAVCCTRRYCNTFDGYIKEYLIFYCLVASVLTLPFVIYGWLKHRDEVRLDKKTFLYTSVSALTVDGINIIFMLYVSVFDAAFYFPLTSVLGVASIMLSSVTVLHERISRKAIIGIILSAAALALLAL